MLSFFEQNNHAAFGKHQSSAYYSASLACIFICFRSDREPWDPLADGHADIKYHHQSIIWYSADYQFDQY